MISDVKNQKACGSCFALGVVETIEAMNAIKTGKLKELSVQQMLDCNDDEMGCDGGDPCRLLRWLQSSKVDVQLSEDYPPSKSLKNQDCDVDRNSKDSGIKVKDYSCDE